jgi:hypothetical protein
MYRQLKKFGDLYFKAGSEVFRKFGFINYEIIAKWPYIIGEQFAQICSPDKIIFPPHKTNEGTLVINITNPGFALSIQAQEARIVEKISTFFGYCAVHRIKVRILPVKNTYPEVIITKPEVTLNEEIYNKIARLGNAELEEAMTGLAKAL